ncbi:MAG: DegQ family serine endoprotease [Pseudomonadota bacterium]
MKFARIQYALVLVFTALLLFTSSAQSAIPLFGGQQEKQSLAPMLKGVMPAVVNISTKSRVQVQENPLFNDPFFRRFFDIPNMPRERESQSLGSGVIIDAKQGHIITNHHVIKGADEITVTLRDRREFEAKLIGSDPEADLAVIQIKADKLTELPLSDSEQLEVGDFVVAIGNPFGLGQTVTSGIVSALGRSGLGIEGYEDFIQTDASINPGNSGGALVTLDGKLIGINTAIVAPSGGNVGIGFAIPANMARSIKDQLIKYGEVRRGQLGVYIQDVTPELAEAFGIDKPTGAVISQVMKDSPADKAGIKPGDVVTALNGTPITHSAQLRNAIGLLHIGDKVTLDITRNGKPQRIKAVIAEPKQEKLAAANLSDRLAGAILGEIAPNHPLAGKLEGVQVLDVERGSPAWGAGLRPADIIVSINRQPVKDMNEVTKALKLSDKGILLNIRRGEGALFIVIR